MLDMETVAPEEPSVLSFIGEQPPARTPEFDEKMAYELAAARSYLETGLSMGDLVQDSLAKIKASKDPAAELFAPMVNEYKVRQTEHLKAAAVARVRAGEDPQVTVKNAVLIKQLFDATNAYDGAAIITGVAAENQAFFEQLTKSADAKPFRYIEQRMAEEGRVFNGFDWEDIADFAGLLFLGDVTAETASLAKFANKILPNDGIVDFARKYQAAGPIQKEQIWEFISPKMWEIFDGNDLKMAQAVMLLQDINPEKARNWMAAIDALTIAAAAFDGVSIFKAARAIGGNKLQALADAKAGQDAIRALRDYKPQAAADLAQARALTDEDKLSAAKNAMPADMEGTVLERTNVVDGIAPEISARMQEGMAEVKSLEDLSALARKSAAEQKAAELDLWAENELAKTGGRKQAEVQAELDALVAERAAVAEESGVAVRKNMQGPRGVISEEAEAKLLELDTKIQRVQKSLDAFDGVKLAREYSRSLKAGRIPEEFASDVAAYERQVMDAWDEAPVNAAGKAAADEVSELSKIKEELGIELKAAAPGRLGTDELRALKEEAAGINRRLAKEVPAEERAALETRRNEIIAAYQKHQEAIDAANAVRAVEKGELTSAQKARVQSAGKPKTAAPAAAKADGAVPEKDPVKAALVEKATQAVGRVMERYKSGEAVIDVAKVAFLRNNLERDKAWFTGKGRTVRSYKVVDTGDNSVDIVYTLDNGTVTRPYKWDKDSLGDWTTEEFLNDLSSYLTAITSQLLSPAALYKKLDKDLVANWTLGGMQSSKAFNDLLRVARSINSDLKLSSASSQRVEQLLQLGDLNKVRFEPEALLGTTNVNGTKYTEEEVLAYLRWRKFYDDLWSVNNNAVHRYMHFQGYRELNISGLDEATMASLPGAGKNKDLYSVGVREASHEFSERLGGTTTKGTGAQVADEVLVVADSGSTYQRMTKADIDSARANGAELYEVHVAVSGKVEGILVHQGEKVKIKPLRTTVLHYQEGYLPRVYKPGTVFVKDVKTFETIGGFGGKKEAGAYINAQGKSGKWQVFEDGAETPAGIEVRQLESHGGLWFMPRRGEALTNPARFDPKTGAAELVPRWDLGTSTQMYLTSVSNMLPLNEYRAGVLAQFSKAVQNTAKIHNGPGFTDPTDVLRSEINTGNGVADSMLRSTRDYLLNQLSVRTREETVLNRFLNNIWDGMEGTKMGGTPRNIVQWGLNAEPLARAKGAVFHMYLGGFNPVQLLVQAQNAVVASTAHPRYALPAWYDAVKMRTILFMDREAILELSRRTGVGYEGHAAELEKLGWWDRGTKQAAALRRSGYFDSVFRTGDYSTQMQGLGGYTLEGARAILRAGTIPFEEGELFSRLVSYNIARRKFLAENPGRTGLSDEDIHAIVQDSLRINMNMQKENAAVWQTYWLTKVPTQFAQVQAKHAEAVFGGLTRGAKNQYARATGGRVDEISIKGHAGLTGPEAARVGFGQLAMYGLISVPLFDQLGGYIASMMGYVDQNGQPDVLLFKEENPNLWELYEEGILGMAMNLGKVNIDVSERFSIPAGFDDNVLVNLFSAIRGSFDPNSTGDMRAEITTPFTGAAQRVVDRFNTMMARARGAAAAGEITFEDVVNTWTDASTVFSSLNSSERVKRWEELGYLVSRSGNSQLEYDAEKMNLQTWFLAKMGLSTDMEQDFYRAREEGSGVQDNQEIAKMYLRKSHDAEMRGDVSLARGYDATAQKVLGNDDQLDGLRRQIVIQKLSGETAQERTVDTNTRLWMQGYEITTDVRGTD